MRNPRKILIVAGEGVFGHEHYATLVKILVRDLARIEIPRVDPGEKPTEAATVETVKTKEEVREKAKKREVDIVIFVSLADYPEAKKLRKDFPNLTVLIFTGREMEGKPYLIPKRFLNQNTIEEIPFL